MPSARNYTIMKIVHSSRIILLIVGLAACAGGPPAGDRGEFGREAGAGHAAAVPVVAQGERPRIVVLGDSLTAGYGLDLSQAYPTLLQEWIEAAGYPYEVVNAGVSGDTSAGGLRRLDWSLQGDVRVLIAALGANDGLRGLPVEALRRNLGTIVERAQDRGIVVVIAGMEAPPNYGAVYTVGFRETFRELARRYDAPLVPFLLEGVAGIPALNLADGMHPNPEGARIVAETVWSTIEPLLSELAP